MVIDVMCVCNLGWGCWLVGIIVCGGGLWGGRLVSKPSVYLLFSLVIDFCHLSLWS